MAITAGTMRAYGRRQMRDQVGSRSNAILAESINAAMLMLAKDVGGNYWINIGEITLNAAYSTGTVALTNGSATATFTGATLPQWAASGKLQVDGQWYKITSRDSDSQLTLTNAWNQATVSGSTYDLYQDEYALPSDLLSLGERTFYGDSWIWGATPASVETVLK